MGGLALAEHLKVRHPDVKILFTSGHTDDALVHDEVGGKRMFFIGKPYTVAGLAYKVRMVLDS
jgi:DNA-binding NarL/FixJ family response regulator